jgi:hypothetical protein
MEFGINVDSLQKIKKIEKKNCNTNNSEPYNIKIKKYNFFVKNEIEISKQLSSVNLRNVSNIAYRFLTVKKYDFIKICETNKEILENLHISQDLQDNNKIVLLKYKNHENMTKFIHTFFKSYVDNNCIYSEKPRAAYIFWDFIHTYETLCDDFIYLASKNIIFVDFSSKNLLYDNKHYLYFNEFEKCLIHYKFNITEKDLSEDGYLQQINKYTEINKYVDKFIEIINSIEYYGNKHFDLYFSKQLIENKHFYKTFQNIDTIIENYLDNLCFLKNFSEKFKNDNKTKWKTLLKKKIQENIAFLNIPVENLNWKLYVLMTLESYNDTVWESFSLNSLFLNISYHMIKKFNINDKSSLIHKFLKCIFMNMDVSCSSFNNNTINSNNNIILCRENYDIFFNSIDKNYFNDLYDINYDQQDELYSFLSQNNVIEQF